MVDAVVSLGRRVMRARILAVVAVLVLAGVGWPAAARAQVAQAEPALLPDVPIVALTGASGTTAKVAPAQGRWLLVHLQPGCAPCEAMLTRIQSEAPAVAARLVIVVSRTTVADLRRMAEGFAALEPAAWYADEAGALAAALQIQEAPVLIAMNDRAIQWTLAGVLSGSQRLRDVLMGWVASPGN